MKYVIFFALVIGTVIAYTNQGDVQIPNSDFVTPFLTHDMIEKINNGDHSWTAASNSFIEGKSVAQVKHLLGFKKNPETRKKGLPIKTPKVSGLPQNYDASKAYPHCTTIGTIYNQADCGSCWAFGCVEAVSDRFCIQSNGTVNITLSFMDEVCCGDAGGCDGGDPYDAWQYVSEGGLVTNDCYPYTIPTCPPSQQPCMNFVDTPNCANQCSNGQNWNNLLHYVGDVYSVSSDQNSIMSEIYTNGPVETCFTVYADFLNYKSGVYQYTSGAALGGHCVKIIGWGVENGLPYWLINNSWTTYWGDNGQFKILRGKDECGIEDEVVAGTPKV